MNLLVVIFLSGLVFRATATFFRWLWEVLTASSGNHHTIGDQSVELSCVNSLEYVRIRSNRQDPELRTLSAHPIEETIIRMGPMDKKSA